MCVPNHRRWLPALPNRFHQEEVERDFQDFSLPSHYKQRTINENIHLTLHIHQNNPNGSRLRSIQAHGRTLHSSLDYLRTKSKRIYRVCLNNSSKNQMKNFVKNNNFNTILQIIESDINKY